MIQERNNEGLFYALLLIIEIHHQSSEMTFLTGLNYSQDFQFISVPGTMLATQREIKVPECAVASGGLQGLFVCLTRYHKHI